MNDNRRSGGSVVWLCAMLMLAGCGGGGGSSAPATFSVSGTVSGLSSEGLTLAFNGTAVPVSSGATTVTLGTALSNGTNFTVTVQSQPAGQTCAVGNGRGTIAGANITNVAVSCSAPSFTLGGSVSGLINGSLVLANGSDTLRVEAGTDPLSFTLPTAVAVGSSFEVTVLTQPDGLRCSVDGGTGVGTMGAADVVDISVTCNALSFTLGGTISGLTSDGLVLSNGSDTVAVAANATTFSMPAAVPFGSRFDVKVQGKARENSCTIGSGSDTMGAADVTNVTVSCGPATFTVSTLAGSRFNASGDVDGLGEAASFFGPQSLAVDASGNVYVADTSNNKVRKITPLREVTTLPGAFLLPRGIAVDLGGNVYVGDSLNIPAQIRVITPPGQVTTTLAAGFNFPLAIAVDVSGNVYVTDETKDQIRKITPLGVVTTLPARFGAPDGVAVDVSGNLYVSDNGNHTIHKITPAGGVSLLAGTAGQFGDADGASTAALFNGPQGVAVDAIGNVYVADRGNHKIRKITPAGMVSTLAGSGEAGSTNAPGPLASFNSPVAVAVDAIGNVYVADRGNHKIRKITQD